MTSINRYLDNIASDFNAYLDEGHTLCHLMTLSFDKGNVPDYNDVHVQQYYLLRYAYSYAFEYKQIYLALFRHFLLRGPEIQVTSIGCGTMLDYWALTRALKAISKEEIQVRYTGIDQVDWSYRMEARPGDTVEFIHNDAIQVLSGREELDADIYFFPKSISEFNGDSFFRLCRIFRETPMQQKKIYLLFSVRIHEACQRMDARRIRRLWDAVEKNGYHLIDSPLQEKADHPVPINTWYLENPEEKIASADPGDFRHPRSAVDLALKLYTRCSDYQQNGRVCESKDCDKRLDRWPVLTKSQIRYVILPFERS